MQPVRLSPAMRSAAAADSGLLVLHVDPDGPADAAGVLLGDILLGLGDRNFRDLREVAAALGPETIATTVQARLLRAGQPTTVDIRIGERAGEDD
jgi:S1-C subfamily serine protease